MHRSLLTHARVNDVMALTYRLKQQDLPVMPIVLLSTDTGEEPVLPLLELGADALARQAQFQAIGRQFPDTTEALFVCETWMVITDKIVGWFGELAIPLSQHSDPQEVMIVVGRNRDKTKTVAATQLYTPMANRVIWQTPDSTTEPGSPEGLVDFIFDP